MKTIAGWLIASTIAVQPNVSMVLGMVERDLTGDGKAETLRVVAVGRTLDNLDATFTIESEGRTVFRFELEPLTPIVGFDQGRHRISAGQQQTRLKEFGPWFFGGEKFQRPTEFVDTLRREALGRVLEIPRRNRA